ncbi:F0F1 ATP synthase subunit A [bacterium]|nr:F0F1 ATP synthase subunit A [bacterium]
MPESSQGEHEILLVRENANSHDASDPVSHGEATLGHVTDAAHDATAAVHGAADAAHGAEAHHGRHVTHPPELPHFVQIWWEAEAQQMEAEGKDPYGNPKDGLTVAQTLHVGRLEEPAPFVDYAPWENNLFAGIAALIIIVVAFLATAPFRRSKDIVMRKPTRTQSAMEALVDGVDSFCQGILGKENGRRYMPYVASLFFFVLMMNFMGLIPLMKAPTASLLITGSLALCTFIYYMSVAIFRLGPLNYLHHLAGSPPTPFHKNLIPWIMAPLIMFIELVSDFFAKPVSLALRLFGNILGKDILMGVMLGLGFTISTGMFGSAGEWFGVPLTFPFYFLGLLLSAIQALIFALLSAIYILLVLPHDEEHEH